MRIISKHRDYYDTVQAYGIDTTSTYIRKIKEFDSDSNELTLIRKLLFPNETYLHRNVDWYKNNETFDVEDFKVIFFCGKIYPFFVFKKTVNWKTTYFNCYNFEAVDSTIRKYGKKHIKNSWINKKNPTGLRFNRYIPKKLVKERLAVNVDEQVLLDLHHKFEVPYFMYSDSKNKIIFNQNLKEQSFYKIYDTFTAYQEIDMFLSGILGGQSPKIIELDDSMRKAKHGFDDWSFKKHPKV